MSDKTRNEMSGIELLRKLADDFGQTPDLYSILRSGTEPWWGATWYVETLDKVLLLIADEIEAELDDGQAVTCEWAYNDGDNAWDTECDDKIIWDLEPPAFCPSCGNRVVVGQDVIERKEG